MTNEEAIRNITAYVYMECLNMPEQVIKALAMASKALERQIPKKPAYIKEHNVIYFDWRCPCCQREYANSSHGIAYCVDCGQAIDWSNAE